VDEETFEELRALMRLAREHRLSELTVESPQGKVRVGRGQRRPAVVRRPREAPPGGARAADICAPLLGVFYRAPAPDAPAYVEVGDWIEPGQTVGLIEAMKVFNEINSEIEGRVVAITAGAGELVQAGQVLMMVELAE